MRLFHFIQMALAIHPYLKMKNYFDKHFPVEVVERYQADVYAQRAGKAEHIKFNRRGRRYKFARFHRKQ